MKSFLLMSLGGVTHILFDTIFRYSMYGYSILFPFSWERFSLGLLWTEFYYIPFLITSAVLIVILFITKNPVFFSSLHRK
jgi:membrane-bound metal-dependent hydrolase YbcI (DUF457 family)